jgi:RNase P subunit RPR2
MELIAVNRNCCAPETLVWMLICRSSLRLFSEAFAAAIVALLVLFVRNEIGSAEERAPDAASIADLDAALPKMAALLPNSINSETELIAVRREELNIVYTIQFRSKAKVDQMRKAPGKNQSSIQDSMKRIACKPEPNKFLVDGFTIVWELVDAKDVIMRSTLKLADCASTTP